jgi:flagellar basal-body rod protein FlgC
MFGTFDISASGMRAERIRMNVVAQNIAEADAVLDENGQVNPYRRQMAVFAQGADEQGTPGVRVTSVVKDMGPLRAVEVGPGNRLDIDQDGIVYYPNVDILAENVDGMLAARAFEANVAAYEISKSMVGNALRILA